MMDSSNSVETTQPSEGVVGRRVDDRKLFPFLPIRPPWGKQRTRYGTADFPQLGPSPNRMPRHPIRMSRGTEKIHNLR